MIMCVLIVEQRLHLNGEKDHMDLKRKFPCYMSFMISILITLFHLDYVTRVDYVGLKKNKKI
jgi:hypothetical protein